MKKSQFSGIHADVREKSYHHGDLRNALKEEAARIIAERGVEGFSLREASRRAGVSAAAAYRHFPNKEALVDELIIDGRASLSEFMERRLTKIDGAATPDAHLRALGHAYVDFASANPNLFRILTGPVGAQTLPEQSQPRDPYNLLLSVLESMRGKGALRDPDVSNNALACWSMVHGLAMLVVEKVLPNPTATGQATVDEAASIVLDALVHGMLSGICG